MSRERPIKVRNLKLLCLFVLFFALACEQTFVKTHNVESRFVKGPEIYCFVGGCLHAHFSPGISQNVAVQGLMVRKHEAVYWLDEAGVSVLPWWCGALWPQMSGWLSVPTRESPDVTVTVDWAWKFSSLSIYHTHETSLKQSWRDTYFAEFRSCVKVEVAVLGFPF